MSVEVIMETLQVPAVILDVNGCNEKHLTREQCIKIVRKHLKSDDFELLSYSVKPFSDKLVGFLGEHFRLRASVLHKQQILDLRFFIKALPKEVSTHAEYVLNTGAFSKEASLYATLLRDLKKVQNTLENSKKIENGRRGSYTVPVDRITSWGPNSYFKTDEILVLEDLSVKGFSIVDVREPLDYDHIVVCLKTVAQFHAASIIFEEKQAKVGGLRKSLEDLPKSIKTEVPRTRKQTLSDLFPNLLFEVLFVETKGHPGNDFFEASITCLVAVIRLLEGYSEMEKEKITKAFPGELRKLMDCVKPYQNYRNVLIHGDLWSNNILFRYEGNMVVEARLVDFQHCRYSPPGHDVMDLLHLTTTRQFREEHLEEFLSLYYDCLRFELKLHSLNLDVLLPWEEFRESCEYFRHVALCTAIIWFQLITMPADLTTSLMASPEDLERNFRVDRTEMVTKCFKADKIFRDRLSEPLHELIQRYILKK